MVMPISDVMSAYKKTGGIIDEASAGTTAPAAGGADFGATLKGFLGDSISSLHEGEKAASMAASGKADLTSVVTAIDNAEIVLEEITTLRDKVISAYQTITSTAI